MADHDSVIAGRNPVREICEQESERVKEVLIQPGGGEDLQKLRDHLERLGVDVNSRPVKVLDRMARGAAHQGVVARVRPKAYVDVDEMLSGIARTLGDVKKKKPLVVVLDQITDPYNFGAILRSAVAAGADGVIVPESHAAPLSPVAVKASAGTAHKIPIAETESLHRTLEAMKERGYWIAGAAGEGEETVWSMEWDRATAIVIGSEGEGLRPHLRRICDFLVRIPMRGPAESLNASVAAGILLFEAARVRLESETE